MVQATNYISNLVGGTPTMNVLTYLFSQSYSTASDIAESLNIVPMEVDIILQDLRRNEAVEDGWKRVTYEWEDVRKKTGLDSHRSTRIYKLTQKSRRALG